MLWLSDDVRQYLLITGNYWAFTLTDGALRMLVVLHFHQLGYTPLQVASLFLFYEVLRRGHQSVRRLARRAHRTQSHHEHRSGAAGRCAGDADGAGIVAGRAVGDGGAGAVGDRQDLNKMVEERHQAADADDRQGALYRWIAALTGSTRSRASAFFSAVRC